MMFTGLVSDVGEVVQIEERGELRRVRIACSYPAHTIAQGASIACSGPCLTAVAIGTHGERTWFDVDVAAETLARTTARDWHVGTKLNLERSLKLGDELGGHIVAGHVDGIATIVSREDLPDMARFVLKTTRELARFVAPKGSVTLDGVSLTINTVDDVTY
jgi:riboflavin synthase